MCEVKYRNLTKEDYETIKVLINEAFGFDAFIKDNELLDAVLTIYLHECICDSSFSKVAEKNNKVIGVILGNSIKDKNNFKNCSNDIITNPNKLTSILGKSENIKTLKEFSKITDSYKEIIEGKKDMFQGCIQLFIVSSESRGLGVGKSLLKYLFEYMKNMSVESLYLFTDTRCNYGFYDSQNFIRKNEKEITFQSFDEKLKVFLYGYEL